MKVKGYATSVLSKQLSLAEKNGFSMRSLTNYKEELII